MSMARLQHLLCCCPERVALAIPSTCVQVCEGCSHFLSSPLGGRLQCQPCSAQAHGTSPSEAFYSQQYPLPSSVKPWTLQGKSHLACTVLCFKATGGLKRRGNLSHFQGFSALDSGPAACCEVLQP